MTRGWEEAWSAALDELEMDVVAAEALLTQEHRARDLAEDLTKNRAELLAGTGSWRPPGGLGPLPLELRPRADAILQRQLSVAENLARALSTNRRQAAMTARIEAGGNGAPRPSYISHAA